MHRIPGVLSALVLLAACDGGAPPPTPVAQLRVGFPPGGVADTIRVDAVERLALRAAELLAPDGAATPASHLEVAATPRVATGKLVASDPWRSALPGSAAVAPLMMPQAGVVL